MIDKHTFFDVVYGRDVHITPSVLMRALRSKLEVTVNIYGKQRAREPVTMKNLHMCIYSTYQYKNTLEHKSATQFDTFFLF